MAEYGGIAVVVGVEQEEFALRSHIEAVTEAFCLLQYLL